jgi:hypothetical protein
MFVTKKEVGEALIYDFKALLCIALGDIVAELLKS